LGLIGRRLFFHLNCLTFALAFAAAVSLNRGRQS
jgi:hypothetical protein